MNYERIYNQLIEKRKVHKLTGYTETHHIQPKSLGGSDSKDNLVELTAKEHFIAHLLLAKFKPCHQTMNAIMIMRCKNYGQHRNDIQNSRMYEWARKEFSKYMKMKSKGVSNSQYGTMWICNIELKENKKISKDIDIPEGWVRGRNKWKHINDRKKLKKRFYITNGVEDKFLSYEDQLPLPDGWFKGKTNYPKKLNITSKGLENKRLGCFSKRGTKYNKTSRQFV